MALLQTFNPQSLTSSAKNPNRCSDFSSFAAKHRHPSSGCSSFATKNPNPSSDISFTAKNPNSASNSLLFPATNLNFSCQSPLFSEKCPTCRFPLLSVNHSKLSFSVSAVSNPDQNPKPKRRGRPKKNPAESPENHQECNQNSDQDFPATLPRKPRRGRRSEAVAVEDFVRKSLEKTLSSIREQNAEVLEGKQVLKEEKNENGDDEVEEEQERVGIVEEEDTDWPLDAEVGWGVRASEYFEKHLIQNVVENGVEIDWEGETDDSWVKEINCLEWESFAFHPSPLIVLVFERYNRAADNWKLLKELEKAIKVYWNAKDRLPPRTVKIDINIEKDLAYALKAKECPQLLFFRGNRLLYREKEIRTADELVLMIAHFYYNAKKPSWIDAAAIASPY